MIGDYDIDVSAGTAVVTLARRIRAVRSEAAPIASDALGVLTPPISASRDHIAGPQWASALLMVFGAYGMPWSRPLGRLLDGLRQAHPGSVCVAWRHLRDPEADPRTVWLALAAEAAGPKADSGRCTASCSPWGTTIRRTSTPRHVAPAWTTTGSSTA